MTDVQISAKLPDGTPIASWVTKEDGTHVVEPTANDLRRSEAQVWQDMNRCSWGTLTHAQSQGQRAHAYVQLLLTSLDKAIAKHTPMNSPHEGYAVLLEEVDELWEEVKKQSCGYGPEAVKEALHVAAMAIRFIIDTVPPSQDAAMTEAIRGRSREERCGNG